MAIKHTVTGRRYRALPLLQAALCAFIPVFAFALSDEAPAPDSASQQAPPGDPRAQELAPLIVRESRLPANNLTAQHTTVDGSVLRNSSRATPLEALSQASAGVYVTSRGAGLHGVAAGSSGGIYLRGLGGSPNSQVLLVEDGVPDYQGIFGHPIPDAFTPALIERVVILKGGDAVRYGSNAMGGVIVVENRWPKRPGFQLENDAAYGSYNTFREQAALFASSGPLDAVAAFSALSTDGHRHGCDASSVAAQAALRIQTASGLTFSLREKIVHLEGADPGPASTPHATRQWFDVTRNVLSARIDMARERLRVEALPWLAVGVHRLYNGFYSQDYTGGGLAQATVSIPLLRLDIVSGLSIDHRDGMVENRALLADTAAAAPNHIEALTSASLYTEWCAQPAAGLAAVMGGRLHYHSRYGWIPLYKAGISWRSLDWLTVQTRLSRNFREPTLRELYLPFPTANPDLRPEYSRNWDAGIELRSRFGELGGAIYHTRATDLIKYFGHWPSAEVTNIDYLEISGLEAWLRTTPLHGLQLLLTACRQDVGRYTRQNPRAKVNGRLAWSATLDDALLNVSLSGEWVHGIYMANYHREPLPDIFFLDASVRLTCHRRGKNEIEPYVIIRNLLNRPYEYIRDYPMPGLHVLAGIRLGV